MLQVIKWQFNEEVASSCPESAAAVEQLISEQKREVEATIPGGEYLLYKWL